MQEVLKVPLYNKKLTNFRYLKADIEFIVHVNAQPFQQGGLILHYDPPGPLDYSNVNTALSHKTSKYSKVLNLAEPSPVTFTIPYTHPIPYYDLTTTPTSPVAPRWMGTFNISVYSALTSSDVAITMYVRMLNVSLRLPTATPAYVPQAGGIEKTTKNCYHLFCSGREYCRVSFRGNEDQYQPQTGRASTTSKTENSISAAITRPLNKYAPKSIATQTTEASALVNSSGASEGGAGGTSTSSWTSFFSKVASAAGIVRMLAIPAAWIAKFVSGGLSAFGWSKPLLVAPPSFVKARSARAMQNSDTVDTSENLGVLSENSISQLQILENDLDELHFDNIITNFVFVNSFNWSVGTAAGTVLYDIYVAPRATSTSYERATSGYAWYEHYTTYIGHVSSFFNLWRGDMRYQFRAFKTSFHSGRLAIVWDPGCDNFAAASDDLIASAYTVIWDLRTQHTTCVTIPYASNRPWLQNPIFDDNVQPDFSKICNGRLRVIVMNPLVANTVASQTVAISVEVAGAPGFCFAIPCTNDMIPVNDTAMSHAQRPGWTPPNTTFATKAVAGTQTDLGDLTPLTTDDESEYVPQVGDDSPLTLTESYITHDIPPMDSLDIAANTIGEHIVSFRQLLKRYSVWPFRTRTDRTGTNVYWDTVTAPATRAIARIDPYMFDLKQPQTSIQTGFSHISTIPVDTIDNVAAMFHYCRGSMRVKIVQDKQSSYGHSLALIRPKRGAGPFDNIDALLHTATTAFFNNSEGVVEVQMPFYSSVSHRFVEYYPTDTKTLIETSYDLIYYNSLNTTSSNNAGVTTMFRAIGDDFNFIFLKGLPRLQCAMPQNNVWLT